MATTKNKANGSATLSLSDLQSQPENDKLELTTPNGATGPVYIRPFNAGLMLDSTTFDGQGNPVVDMSVLLDWIVFGVVDENGKQIFSSADDVKALSVQIYGQITTAVLAKLNREQTVIKGKDETATSPESSVAASSTVSPVQ